MHAYAGPSYLTSRQQANTSEPHRVLGFRGAEAVDGNKEWPSQAFQVRGWSGKSDYAKLSMLRKMAEYHGRDPRLREFVINNVLSGVPARDYRGQASAILRWVQREIRYVNESNEQLQTPSYTLRVRFGDCDDMAILIGAMAHSIALPFRYCLAGRNAFGQQTRWMEGMRPSFRARYSHIYVALGIRGPFASPKSQIWLSAEPTLPVPLGWDVVVASQAPGARAKLPELHGTTGLAGSFAGADANTVVVPKAAPQLPAVPARMAAGFRTLAGQTAVQQGIEVLRGIFGPDLAVGIAKGVITMLATQIIVSQLMKRGK